MTSAPCGPSRWALEAGEGDVAIEHLAPAAVTDRHGAHGRADDVGEHHGHEHAIRLGTGSRAGDELLDLTDQQIERGVLEGLEQVIIAGTLGIPSAADMLGQAAAGLDWHRAIARPIPVADGGTSLYRPNGARTT
jgi:hypothetical protein